MGSVRTLAATFRVLGGHVREDLRASIGGQWADIDATWHRELNARAADPTGGRKGMLTLDPNLSGRALGTHTSMAKIQSNCWILEICHHAVFMPCYLNCQLIILLSALGVPDQVFMDLQARTKHSTNISHLTLSTPPSNQHEAAAAVSRHRHPGAATSVVDKPPLLSWSHNKGVEPPLLSWSRCHRC